MTMTASSSAETRPTRVLPPRPITSTASFSETLASLRANNSGPSSPLTAPLRITSAGIGIFLIAAEAIECLADSGRHDRTFVEGIFPELFAQPLQGAQNRHRRNRLGRRARAHRLFGCVNKLHQQAEHRGLSFG